MGRAIQQLNKMAKDPEAEKLGIQVKAEEWEKALATVSGRRSVIKATGRGATEAAQQLAYARVVKPKIIKTLMDQVKSGNLKETNPKGYAQRLQRIHDNFDDLLKKEGDDYRTLGRRELVERVGKVMEPEIKETTEKVTDWATKGTALYDTFLGPQPEVTIALKRAGITDKKAQFVMRLLMKAGGVF